MSRPCVRVCWALFCTFAFGLLATPRAQAQRTSSLGWARLPGAEDCISTQALAERVEQRLGRRVFVSASQADLALEGRVERAGEPSEIVATLVVSDRTGRVLGRRVLRVQGADCRALEASLVLVIAIAIDPGVSLPAVMDPGAGLSGEARAMLEQLDLPQLDERQIAELAVPDEALAPRPGSGPAAAGGEPAGSGGTRREGPSRVAADAEAETGAETDSGLSLRLQAGVALELGVLPQPALGATLGVMLQAAGFWPLEAALYGLLGQEQAVPGAAPGLGELQLFAFGLALCPALAEAGRVLLRACGGARVGLLLGQGEGFAEPLTSTGFWLEPVLSLGAWLRLSPWSLHASAGAGVPLARDTFIYEDGLGRPRPLYRPAPLTGRFELGAGLHF